MKSIVGFGALNLDLIFEVEDFKSISSKRGRLEPGKEAFGSDEDFQHLFDQLNRFGTLKSKSGGGSAANTIVALARMGFQTKFIGKVGEDEEGDFLLENLRPVQTDWIRRGQRSGICLVVLDRRQDRFLFVRGNANNSFGIDEIDLNNLGDVVQNYQFLLRDSTLIIAMAMAEVPTPKFWAISTLEIPISRPK